MAVALSEANLPKTKEVTVLPQAVCSSVCLQCFDAVGWAAGRASGL